MTLDELDAAYAAMTGGEWHSEPCNALAGSYLYGPTHASFIASSDPNLHQARPPVALGGCDSAGIVALHNHYPAVRGLLRRAVELLVCGVRHEGRTCIEHGWTYPNKGWATPQPCKVCEFLVEFGKTLAEATANG